MKQRVVGFALVAVAVVVALVGLGSASYVPPSLGALTWFRYARIFGDPSIATGQWASNTSGVGAGAFSAGVAAVALLGLGLIIFSRRN